MRARRWGWATVAAVVVIGGCVGCTAAVTAGREAPSTAASSPASHVGSAGSSSPRATAGAGSAPSGAPRGNNAAAGPQDPAPNETPATAPDATPVSVTIPSIRVTSTLESLHKDGTGALVPPADFNRAGWYSDGVVPGHTGPAIIAGHVDSLTSAAIFFDLDELAAGDDVQVAMSDGTTLHFTVTGSQQASKKAFPTSNVYGTTPTPQLRLITCGGTFDRTAGHYTDNLIVFADLVSD